MSEEEQLVAEQVVPVGQERAVTVRISQHTSEEFWRVDVSLDPAAVEGHMTATVASGDSFMMNLIQGAVSGEAVAWRHLAHWGQDNLTRSALVPGRRFA